MLQEFWHRRRVMMMQFLLLLMVFFFGGWWFEPLWKIVVTWDDYSHILWKSKKCAKPPTSFLVVFEKLMFDLTLPWQYKSKYELLNTYFQIAASVQTRIYAG